MYLLMKRTLDWFFSSALLILLVPVGALIVAVVFLVDGRPVFLLQVRPGLHGKPFKIVKFRTMSSGPVADDGDESARVTKLGKMLRRTSIDELPSLWNVVRGDMSFVGPRPLLVEYLSIYSPRHSKRHAVRPGLTGLAQVGGRNLVSWEKKLDMDVEYVENFSFWLDMKILLKTFVEVIRIRGIDQADGSTMARLKAGYESD